MLFPSLVLTGAISLVAVISVIVGKYALRKMYHLSHFSITVQRPRGHACRATVTPSCVSRCPHRPPHAFFPALCRSATGLKPQERLQTTALREPGRAPELPGADGTGSLTAQGRQRAPVGQASRIPLPCASPPRSRGGGRGGRCLRAGQHLPSRSSTLCQEG